ncbi:MAG: hypothetical protein GC181_10915 [Bacteroidetes bacterium]|nr:hypothetical protein [Bacteroidota bacterium]
MRYIILLFFINACNVKHKNNDIRSDHVISPVQSPNILLNVILDELKIDRNNLTEYLDSNRDLRIHIEDDTANNKAVGNYYTIKIEQLHNEVPPTSSNFPFFECCLYKTDSFYVNGVNADYYVFQNELLLNVNHEYFPLGFHVLICNQQPNKEALIHYFEHVLLMLTNRVFELRNDYSITKYHTEFESLTQNKRSEVIRRYPTNMYIEFDVCFCSTPFFYLMNDVQNED